MHRSRRIRALFAVALIGTLGLAACGDDGEEPAATGDERAQDDETTTTTPAAGQDVTVTGIDYAYEGLPAEVEAGTTISFKNGSEKEPHEMVVFKLPEGEERTLQELLQLPEDEVGEVVGAPVGVNVAAMPGSDGQVVEGEMAFNETGRYISICTFPVGTDPQRVAEATGPLEPREGDGPPHFTRGMAAEFAVT